MQKTILIIVAVALVGCASTSTSWVSDPSDPNNVKIEKAIREVVNEERSELTKVWLDKVGTLSLSDRQLTDLKSLVKLSQLHGLNLSLNQLTDLNGLENLTKLESLSLNGNQLTNVKELENLTWLRKLRLDNNRLTSVKGLENLIKLTELVLNNNPDLTKAQIAELQKALPNCKIYYGRGILFEK
jgi:Leucine-rich repeat (LRR) protein